MKYTVISNDEYGDEKTLSFDLSEKQAVKLAKEEAGNNPGLFFGHGGN